VIATKFGSKLDPSGGPQWVGLDSRPEQIKEAAEGSLPLRYQPSRNPYGLLLFGT
jgi:hypothetical protein